MNDAATVCFICGGERFAQATSPYRRCVACGHEVLAAQAEQTLMLNEILRPADIRRLAWVDRFQGGVLDRFSQGRSYARWIDIGSGAGKLLFHHRAKFAHAVGLEITPAAREFARTELGLEVRTSIEEVEAPIDYATAWHSLEHFPAPALEALLRALGAKMPPGGRLIVSVPNAASWQYRLFGARYAFFDVPNHQQQFTIDSLQRLLTAHDFRRVALTVSWPYNAFGWVQGLLNAVVPEHNCLYYRLKRGRPPASRACLGASLALLPLAVPAGLVLALLDAVFPARQAVLTCCFERER